jgi:hypothetical protein
MSNARDPKDTANISSFTIDSEKSDLVTMPGITRLLNRKSLNKGDGLLQPPPPPSSPPQITTSKPKIQPTTRLKASAHVATKKFLRWDHKALQTIPDPLTKGLLILLSKGITAALFLESSTTGASPPNTPMFSANAALASPEQFALWEGVTWNPMTSPHIWETLIKEGFIELSPTTMASNFALRKAFGAENDEYLTLVRVGLPNAYRGVLALLSKNSTSKVLPEALVLFFTPPPTTSTLSGSNAA